jgi:hypothetical protein
VTEGNAAAVPDNDGDGGGGAVSGAVGDAVDAVVSIYY